MSRWVYLPVLLAGYDDRPDPSVGEELAPPANAGISPTPVLCENPGPPVGAIHESPVLPIPAAPGVVRQPGSGLTASPLREISAQR